MGQAQRRHLGAVALQKHARRPISAVPTRVARCGRDKLVVHIREGFPPAREEEIVLARRPILR
jgi:hypothetical protein